MTSTAASLMTAAARRLSRSTASTMVLRQVSGSHKLTIDGYKSSKVLPRGHSWDSKAFPVGDHSWRIKCYPNGNDGHLAVYLELDPTGAMTYASDVKFKFSLLDLSGNPVPEFTRATTEPCSLYKCNSYRGFGDFIKWEDLEKSGYIKDDAFTIQCDVTFTTDLGGSTTTNDDAAAPATAAAPVPASNTHEHLITDILWKQKRGVDVTIDVGGEATFDAHGWLLAARSPVLEAELLAAKEKRTAAGGVHRRIEIQGVDPKVFKAVLHYMYTDSLPAPGTETDQDAMAMAQGLLAAADRFKLARLKLVCEETLSRRIDVGTAAETLAVAEQHGCGALRAACLEFMARPGNLVAVMDTEGFEKGKEVIANVVMTEVFMKKAARFI